VPPNLAVAVVILREGHEHFTVETNRYSSTVSPWKWRRYDPSKQREIFIRRHSLTCQNVSIIINTAETTSKLVVSSSQQW